MKRLVPWLFPALLLASQPSTARPSERDRWIRVDAPHFTLLSNAQETTVRRVATELEELFEALSRTLGRPDLASPVPTAIFVFRSSDSFAPYRPYYGGRPADVVGYFLPHAYGNFVAVDGDPKTDTTQVIYHEYVHYILDSNFPNLPLWLNEGLAEYYSTFQVFKGEARLGVAIAEHVLWLRRNTPMPLADLFAIEKSSDVYSEASRQGTFYAQSWALVHALFAADRDRRRRSVAFLEALRRGAPVEGALREAYGMTLEELESEHRGYVRGRRRLPWVRLDSKFATSDVELSVRPLERHEVLYHLGRLLSHSGPERYAEAAEHFRAALAERPGHGPSLAGQGFLAENQGRIREATAFYERAAEQAPDDVLFYYLYGQNQLRPLAGRSFKLGDLDADTRARVDKARRAFRRCLEIDRGFAEPLAGLGATYLFEAEGASEGLEALEEAWRRLPGRLDVAFNLVLLAAQTGHRERAHELIVEALAPRAKPLQVERARNALLEADFNAAGKLDAEERLEEALAVLASALARTEGALRRKRLEERIDELRFILEERAARRARRDGGELL